MKENFPNLTFEIVTMTTKGDNILDKALFSIGDKSLFTKELEVALIANKVDLVVHSLKDVPTELPPGLTVGAILKRDDPRDALIIRKGCQATNLSELPEGSVVGTSSMRRTAQLRKLHPKLEIQDVRGNLNTRLRKLDEDCLFDALILAAAGLERLGWSERITQVLELMYAVGQGAMCVECRLEDVKTLEMLSTLVDPETVIQCVAERSFLRRLEGGCSVPVAVKCHIIGDEMSLEGGVYSIDGVDGVAGKVSRRCEGFLDILEAGKSGKKDADTREFVGIYTPSVPLKALEASQNLGFQLADQLKESGATPILKEAKKQTAEMVLAKKAKHKTAATS